MKFGKKIRSVVHGSVPSWQLHFLNYKALKQCLSPASSTLPSTPSAFESPTDSPDIRKKQSQSRNGNSTNEAASEIVLGSREMRQVGEEGKEQMSGNKHQPSGQLVGGIDDTRKESTAQVLKNCSVFGERSIKFFELLQGEVDKVNEFYLEKEEDVIIQYDLLSRRVRRMLRRWDMYVSNEEGKEDSRVLDTRIMGDETHEGSSGNSIDDIVDTMEMGSDKSESDTDDMGVKQVKKNEAMVLKQMLINLHAELVLLGNFCTVNYTGLRKILKKHDKKTGLKVREPYMKAVLILPFLRSDTVPTLLRKIEIRMKEMERVGWQRDVRT